MVVGATATWPKEKDGAVAVVAGAADFPKVKGAAVAVVVAAWPNWKAGWEAVVVVVGFWPNWKTAAPPEPPATEEPPKVGATKPGAVTAAVVTAAPRDPKLGAAVVATGAAAVLPNVNPGVVEDEKLKLESGAVDAVTCAVAFGCCPN